MSLRWSFALGLVLSFTALAQSGRPTLVSAPLAMDPHPLLLKSERELHATFERALDQRSGTIHVSKLEAAASIKQLNRSDFRESDEALAELARSSGALYALYAELQYSVTKKLTLVVRVVRDDGVAIKNARAEIDRGKQAVTECADSLLDSVLAQLDLGDLPTVKPAAVVISEPPPEPPPIVEPPAPVVTVVPPTPVVTSDVRNSVGPVLLVTGGVAVIAGGVLAGIGGSAGAALHLETHDGYVPAGDVSKLESARALTAAGIASLGAGAAIAIVGGIIWATAPAAPAKVSLVPMRDGAMLSIGGSF